MPSKKNKENKTQGKKSQNMKNTSTSEIIEEVLETEVEGQVDTDQVETDQVEEKMVSQDTYKELNDKYLRTVAEYDNFRKRTQKEKAALYESSLVDVCKAWLPVLDNLDRAVEALDKLESQESKQMAEGLDLVRKQAVDTLEQLGVAEIESMGVDFNPEYHEAIAHIESPDHGENEIIDVIKKGYIKGENVIRHSQVCVAN